jgi:uncharacterized protein (TIGR00369 family)
MTVATGHEALNPDFADVVRASFAKQGFLAKIGTTLVEVTPGSATLSVTYSADISQQQGFFHGAVIGALGDCAGGYAALSLMPAGSEVVTVEYKVNFLKPAVGERLTATAKVLRAGRSLTIAQADVYTTDADGYRIPVAAVQGTFMRVEV